MYFVFKYRKESVKLQCTLKSHLLDHKLIRYSCLVILLLLRYIKFFLNFCQDHGRSENLKIIVIYRMLYIYLKMILKIRHLTMILKIRLLMNDFAFFFSGTSITMWFVLCAIAFHKNHFYIRYA